MLVAAALAALVLAAPAGAKEPVRATICGASGGTTVTERETLLQIPGGEATTPLGRVTPYYTVEVVTAEPGQGEHSFTMYYVPAANAMAWEEDGVVRLHPIFGEPTTRLMRRLAEPLRPFHLRITSARVGGRMVTGRAARAFGRLYAEKRVVTPFERPPDWLRIDLGSSRPSPWTDASVDLVYSPSANLLEYGYQLVEVDEELAAVLGFRRGPEAQSERARWPWFAAGAAALLAVAGVGRRRASASRPPSGS